MVRGRYLVVAGTLWWWQIKRCELRGMQYFSTIPRLQHFTRELREHLIHNCSLIFIRRRNAQRKYFTFIVLVSFTQRRCCTSLSVSAEPRPPFSLARLENEASCAA